MKKTLLLLIVSSFAIHSSSIAQTPAAPLRVNPNTGAVVDQSNFWTGNAAGICSGINATVAPALANVVGLPAALDGKQPLNANLTVIAALTTAEYGMGFLSISAGGEALSYIGIPFAETPATDWGNGRIPVWTSGAFDSFASSEFSRGFMAAESEAEARSAIGLSVTDTVAFGSLGIGNITIEEDHIMIHESGDINFDGNTFSSLFDGTGGNVANADHSNNSGYADSASYASTSGSAENANTASTAGSANMAYTDPYGNSLGPLFDGTGGNVLFAQTAFYDENGNLLSKVFDGSGGYVLYAAQAANLDGVSGTLSINGAFTTSSDVEISGNSPYLNTKDIALTTPVTGFTATVGNSRCDSTLHFAPAGTLATGTILIPDVSNSVDTQIIRVFSTQTITALTMTVSGSGTIIGAPTTLPANTGIGFQRASSAGNGTWVRIY